MRPLRTTAIVVAALAVLFALHVQLNRGGWARWLRPARAGGPARGELVVGFLPVT